MDKLDIPENEYQEFKKTYPQTEKVLNHFVDVMAKQQKKIVELEEAIGLPRLADTLNKSKVQALQYKVEDLEKALNKYGNHLDGCEQIIRTDFINNTQYLYKRMKCTCGLDKALKRQDTEPLTGDALLRETHNRR